MELKSRYALTLIPYLAAVLTLVAGVALAEQPNILVVWGDDIANPTSAPTPAG